MKSYWIGLGFLILSSLAFHRVSEGDDAMPSPLRPSLAFQLPTVDGGEVVLAARSEPQLTVFCFLATECPLAKLYGSRLEGLQKRYASQHVRLIGIDSNRQDSEADIRSYIEKHGLTFPFVKDYDNRLADRFGAQRTAEVFVVDQTLTVRYHGRIDDQFQPGISRDAPTRLDLQSALDELLAGKRVSVPSTTATGCLIGRLRKPSTETTVTYCKDVATILEQHCVECHRAGEIGPFALTDYDEILGWGDTMIETINDGRMPPWNANPAHGTFANARVMPQADKQILREWVAAGMPYGDKSQLPKPSAEMAEAPVEPAYDLAMPMRDRPFVIPAAGVVDYQYFVIDPHFTEDRWVSAAEVIPGNRGVVHHALVFIRPPDGIRLRGVGWLTAYVPGQKGIQLPPGLARRVPAGSKFVFQMHYTPNGSEQNDLTRVGMTFVPAEVVTQEVFSIVAMNQEFEIPPETANFPVHAKVRQIPPRGELLGMAPHMHLRGQAFQVVARNGGESQILLDVPKYDFNWQHVYALSTPLSLSFVESLEITARFDNSRANPANPDPTQTVTWGDQTWEEMAIGFFEVAVPLADDGASAAKAKPVADRQADVSRDVEEQVEKFVTEFFQRHDRNSDGVILRAEPSQVFRSYGFRQVDQDNDGKITRSEVEAVARRRFAR
ncbi:redoxin domain-containing protein [bacterium]|nr:redoxin domain-containing protein [bacterium]